MLAQLTIIIIILVVILIFYFVNMYLKRVEHLCFGNDFCNRNKDNALCINQKCKKCGLVPECKKDCDCAPNNCINGCCDTM